jgi:hypothetical protein
MKMINHVKFKKFVEESLGRKPVRHIFRENLTIK